MMFAFTKDLIVSSLGNVLLGFLVTTAVGCARVTTDLTTPPSAPQGYCGCKTNVNGHKRTWTPNQITKLGCETFCDNLDNCTAQVVEECDVS
jgi:hypothetical protein